MISICILFLGTFWEVSMDIIGVKHNYEQSIWKTLALWLDKRRLYRLGSLFWDNSIAWSNKWKNLDPQEGEVFPGSSTFLVTFMDGWHLVKFIWLMHLFTCIVLYEPISSYFLLDILILYTIFGIGHEFFWKLVTLPHFFSKK